MLKNTTQQRLSSQTNWSKLKMNLICKRKSGMDGVLSLSLDLH